MLRWINTFLVVSVVAMLSLAHRRFPQMHSLTLH
jgi:hypothetical protein